MEIIGIPETFWIVTLPTAHSELADCCFQCDFKTFALQVRGGLEADEIVGIYADEELATAAATKLIAAFGGNCNPDTVTHPSPWPDWFATQENCRSVLICNKASEEKVKVEPPADWGSNWAWNINDTGAGIVMRRLK